jgi:hypothetical protein
VRQELLDAIYDCKPFHQALRDFGLTPNQVWGLTKTDQEWSQKLEAALTATRRDDLKHGTNAAYVAGCVCQCREHTSESAWPATADAPTLAAEISRAWHTSGSGLGGIASILIVAKQRITSTKSSAFRGISGGPRWSYLKECWERRLPR